MRKKLWFFFIIILISKAFGLYSTQPRFRSDNGHLYIESSTNHNISLITKGQGFINVNNENLLQIIGLAKEAWDVVESFRSNDLPAFADTIKNVIPMIDGPKSLTNRVTALEMQMLNGTATTLPIKGKDRVIPNAGKIAARLNNLEKKVLNLVNLLSISECLSNPCQNGGTCMDLYNGFQCNCPQNWQGRLCDVDVDECVRFLHTDLGCQNGAECKNTPGSYECLCAPNWYGLHCTRKKNDCNGALSSELCGNGVCINQASSIGGYTCICNQGWTTDGGNSPACTTDVDECKENRHTCSVNPPVECKNTRGSFTCGNCPRGYEGDGFVCTDVNECLINNGGCSINPKVQCINTLGSFKCEPCPPGYIGDGINCVYATGGACAINNGGCHPNAECTVYAETTIQCTCRRGFRGNGFGIRGCIADITTTNPCANNPCGFHGFCIINENNNFTCICNRGYTGNTCNISIINNICYENPCVSGECVPGNDPNEFTCDCNEGYFGHLCESRIETCGGYFETSNGVIRYPESNQTLTYQNNLDCSWIIDVNMSYVLNISFVWIDIEKTINCVSDYVEIINNDDDDNNSLGKFCGDTLPKNNSIVSDSNTVIIRFHSDRSKNGRGFQLEYKMLQPFCGGVLNIDSHGTLASPGSPGKYPPNRDCYWTLNATPGKRIQLNFFSLQFERHLNCSYDYLEIRDGFTQHSPILAKLCNTTIPPPILTSGPHARFHFHSDNSGQDYGFQMTYSLIEGIPGCGGVHTSPSGILSSPTDLTSDSSSYLDNLYCEWHIKLPLHQKLKLSFIKKFGIESSKNCANDFLEIHDGPNIKSPLIGRYCGSTRFTQPIITNSNEVTIIFKTDFSATSEGFTIKYETSCGGTFTDSKGIIESPFYPNPYPQNKICTYIIAQPIGKAIRLSILDMEIEDQSYPNCVYDSLEIRDGDNENSTRIAMLCGSIEKLPKLPYLSTHNYMWLQFSTDHSNNNKGFRANYSTIDIACGGILKGPSGIIQSSKHSEQYLNNQMCKWIISVNESSQIQITWLTFSLENQVNCNNDYVEVYDNSISGNSSKIARYCGTKVPPVLTSLGNRLTIVFRTDFSVALDGFMLSYVSISKAQMCGGNFFTSEGYIKSPNFPNDYPKLRDCSWIIHVPVTNQIELNISQFLLEDSISCRFDFLEIRNGGYPTSPLIGKYCGSKILPIISSISNTLFIRFVSDGTRSLKGFFMQWYTTTKGCGGTLNSGVGHIVSPNYPLPVQETLECFYKIAVAQGNQIKLTILDLELVTNTIPGSFCKDDFLEFYDGGNTASKSLGTFCTDYHSPTLIQSTSNQMYIKFRSSGFSKGRGFSLKYTTDCNVTIKGYHGAIEIAKQENLKTNQCAWTIVAPKSSKVNITFTSIKLFPNQLRKFMIPNFMRTFQELKHNCNNTQLTISEGVNINEINTILWKHCESNIPSIISSTKNIVRVNYNLQNNLYFIDKFDSFRLEWVVDGCGGILDKFDGEFTSPGYPGSYSSNTTCEWNIVADYGEIIEITIHSFDFEITDSCIYDYLAIFNGHDDSGTEIIKLCHKELNSITVTSGGDEVFVRFESDASDQRKGFKATYKTIPSKCGGRFTAPQGTFHTINYPNNYDANTTCMWFIEIAESHLINLTFVDFSTRNFPSAFNDKVLVYDGDIHGKLLLNHSGNVVPPPVISSSNKILVSFKVGNHNVKSKGFKAIYSMACGAKLITNDSGIITSKSYIKNQNCSWTIISDTIQSKVTLTITDIDLMYYRMHLRGVESNTTSVCDFSSPNSVIKISDGIDSDAPEILRLCKINRIPPQIVSNGPAMRIEFINNGFGLDSFTAMYSVRSIACGGTYNTIRGTISSPNYPNNYLRDSECVWTLNSSIGNRLSMKFITFELEQDEFCNDDYVEIREHDSIGRILGIYCGSNLPTNVTSDSSLWVKFRSNSDGSAKGFTADFNYETENYFTQSTGEISNPTYPNIYKNIDDYTWTISVDQGKRIQIVFKEISISSQIHHLKIYDGSNSEALLLLETDYYSNIEESITSSDNVVYIQLKAGYKHIGGILFLLSWTQVDKPYTKTLYPEFQKFINKSSHDYYLSKNTNTSVIITSPGYPNGYSPNLNVTWTIHTEPNYHIEIEFLDIDLQPKNPYLDFDFDDYINVETVDPDSGSKSLLKRVVSQKSNTMLIGKNKVVITFISNKMINGTGFKAEARLKCGGQLTGPSGIIEVSNVTSKIGTIELCSWNVTVRPGNTISVRFHSVHFTSSNSCKYSYVLFKNGFYDDSPLLGQGKYCSDNNEMPLSTTGNKLQVQVILSPLESIVIFFEEKSLNCGGQINLNDIYNVTQISSPSYPNIPPAHIECIWTVVAPAGERIFAVITDLDLLVDVECKKEYLEFRDGAARFSSLLYHICHTDDILDIETSDNFLYIKYFTDISVPSNGFQLNLSIVTCGGIRHAHRGIISSPNYPGSYEPNKDCEYKIIVESKYQIILNFDELNLNRRFETIGKHDDIKYNETFDDSLTIYDVDPINNTRIMISRIFGSNKPSNPIKSSGRELVIIFKSYSRNGPFYEKNTQAKFLISYWTKYNDCFKLYNAESGEINNPRLGFNVERMYCTYVIKVPLGRRITAEITKGRSIVQTCDAIEQAVNKNKEIIAVSHGINHYFSLNLCIEPEINPLTSNYIFESTSNKMIIGYQFFHGNQIGFQLKFSSNKPSRCGGLIDTSTRGILQLPVENVTQYFCNWHFTNVNGTIVIIGDFHINESKLVCNRDYLLFVSDEDENVELKTYCPDSSRNDKFIILSPLPLVKLIVKSNVKLINFTATFNYYVNSCGGIISGRLITITSPNYPQNYQQNNNCAWIVKLPEGQNINIHFNDIDLESSCDNNYVSLYDGSSPESPELGKYCGNVLPDTIVATSNEILIMFSSDNGVNKKKGFNLTLESVEGGCGNIYMSEVGELNSKNYPNLYPNNEDCEWIIKTQPGNKINLQFVERFSLEQSVNCTKDYVQVFDYVNDNWVQIGNRLCGRQIPTEFSSTETKLKIRLRTDGNKQSDGFKVKWKNICGGVFTENNGKIISPNYPRQYPNNLHCKYIIQAPGKNIQMQFKSFSLEDNKCRFDNLTIYDKVVENVDDEFNIKAVYCGEQIPRTFMFENSVMLLFKTDESISKTGFEIHYEWQECGGEMTTQGIIKPPLNYNDVLGLDLYANNLNCTWIIRAPPNQVVQLVFTKFLLEGEYEDDVPEEEKCPYDDIVVFDESEMNSSNPQYLGHYCGHLDHMLPEIKSKTNTMYVQFTTDSSKGDRGFVGEVSFTYGESMGCGGTIRLNQSNSMSSYTLKTPKLQIKTNLVCGWLILVEPSYVIQTQVISYTETPKCPLNTTECRCSSIELFDGPGRMAYKINKYCSGKVDNPPLLTSGNEAFILYTVSDTDVNVDFEIKITPVISTCGPNTLVVTNKTQVLTSPNYPLPFGNNLNCYWSLQLESNEMKYIILNFTDLDLESTKDCLSDYLEIKYKESSYMPFITFRLCHEDHELNFIKEVWSAITLKLHTDNQKPSKGFRLEYKSSKCQAFHDKRNGRITYSENGVLNLNFNATLFNQCTFTINPGQKNSTISAYITSLYFSGPATNNYLKVYDGPDVSSPLLTTMTNNFTSIFSTGPSLTMTIISTKKYPMNLDLSYTSTDQGRGCGGSLFNIEGTITSPLYPFVYRKSSTCRWDIAVPRPYPVGIAFRIFDLGTRKTCDTNYLELYNVDQVSGQSSFVAKYCGGDMPAYHISQSGAVFIRYVTTTQNTGSGWVMRFALKKSFT